MSVYEALGYADLILQSIKSLNPINMKTNFLKRLSIVTIGVVSCCAFNTASAQWSITGNSGTTIPTNFVGTIDSVGLVIKTHNIERIRILAGNGDVGVGTTTPLAPLDVNGSIRGAYNASTASYFGDVAIGYCGQSGASFASITNNTSTGYALLQTSTNTYLNCVSSNTIVFRNGNTNEGGWSTTGLGIGTTSPAYSLELSANSAGKPVSSTWTVTSDSRTKTNVQPYLHGLDLIRKVRLVSYEYNGMAHTPKGLYGIGVIAQELQPLFPNSVKPFTVKADSTNPGGEYYGVDFHELFITNVKAVQELDAMNTSLVEKNTALQNQVNTMQSEVNQLMDQVKALQSSMNNVMSVKDVTGTLSNIVVYPNPTDKIVNIQIKQSLQNGEVDVYDLNGRLISQKMNIAGNNKLNIDLSAEAKGVYVVKVKDGSGEIYSQKVILQ